MLMVKYGIRIQTMLKCGVCNQTMLMFKCGIRIQTMLMFKCGIRIQTMLMVKYGISTYPDYVDGQMWESDPGYVDV